MFCARITHLVFRTVGIKGAQSYPPTKILAEFDANPVPLNGLLWIISLENFGPSDGPERYWNHKSNFAQRTQGEKIDFVIVYRLVLGPFLLCGKNAFMWTFKISPWCTNCKPLLIAVKKLVINTFFHKGFFKTKVKVYFKNQVWYWSPICSNSDVFLSK